jgi:hypothetical protein
MYVIVVKREANLMKLFEFQITIISLAGGDISPDGTEVLVKTKDHIYYWKLADGDIVAALTQPGIKVPYHKV